MWGKSQTKRFTEPNSSSSTLGPGCYETERGENLLRSKAYSKLVHSSSDRFSKENRKSLSNLGPGSYELDAKPSSILKEGAKNIRPKTRRVSTSVLTNKSSEDNGLISSGETGGENIISTIPEEKNTIYEFHAAETENDRLRKRLRSSYTENSKLELSNRQLKKDLHDLRVNSTYTKQLKTLQLLTKDIEFAALQREFKALHDVENGREKSCVNAEYDLEEFGNEAYKANVELLMAKVQSLEEMIKTSEVENDALNLIQSEREEKLRSQLFQKEEEIQDLRTHLEGEKEELFLKDMQNEGIINKLEMEKDNKDAKLLTLKVKYSSLLIDFESLKTELTFCEQEKCELEKKIHEKEFLAEQACIEQEVLKLDVEALDQRLNIEKLEHESLLTATQFANDAKLEEITEDLAACMTENYTLTQRLRRQEVAFNVYRLALVSSMTRKWRAKVTEKQENIEILKGLMIEKDKKIDDLALGEKILEQKLDEMRENLGQLQLSSSSEIAKTKQLFETHIRKSHEKNENLKARHKTEVDELQSRLADTDDAVVQLKTELSKKLNDLKQADEKFAELKKNSEIKITETQKTLKMLQLKFSQEMEESVLQNEKLKSLLADEKAESLALIKKYDCDLSKANADFDQLQKRHKQDTEDYEVALEEYSCKMQGAFQMLEKFKKNSSDEISSLKLSLENAEKENVEKKKEYEDALEKINLKDSRVQELEETAGELEASICGLRKENSTLKNQVVESTNAIVLVEETMNASLKYLSTKNEELCEKVQQLDKLKENSNNEINELKVLLDNAEKANLAQVEQYQSALKQIECRDESIKECEKKIDFLSKKGTQAEKAKDEANDALIRYKAEQSAHVKKMEADISDFQLENSLLKKQVQESTNAITLVEQSMNESLKHLSTENEKLLETVQKLEKFNEDCNDEINRLKMALGECEKLNLMQQERYEGAMKQVDSTEGRVKDCEKRLSILTQKNTELIESKTEQAAQIETLEAKMTDVLKENSDLRKQVAEGTNAIVLVEESMNASLQHLSAENEELRKEVEVKAVAVEKLSADFKARQDKMQVVIRDCREEISKKEALIKTLEEQNGKHEALVKQMKVHNEKVITERKRQIENMKREFVNAKAEDSEMKKMIEIESQKLRAFEKGLQIEAEKISRECGNVWGHQNHKQKIQYLKKIKMENIKLKEQVAKLKAERSVQKK